MTKKLINVLISFFILILGAVGLAIITTGDDNFADLNNFFNPPVSGMKITSSAFSNHQAIPTTFTCNGDNTNPPLQFSDIPSQAKSLVLLVEDPDAPQPNWLHWLVYNIPPQTTSIAQNSLPDQATQGTNDFDTTRYQGPCPPLGQHRYNFKLYALDQATSFPPGSTRQAIESAIDGHVIATAELIGIYQRPDDR